jgi:hypothetical protein
MENIRKEDNDNLVTELLLTFEQDKRTALAMTRIGITTLVAQITILGFLIAASRYYRMMEVMHLVIPFILLNLVVFGIAGCLIFRSIFKIHQIDRQIMKTREGTGIHF